MNTAFPPSKHPDNGAEPIQLILCGHVSDPVPRVHYEVSQLTRFHAGSFLVYRSTLDLFMGKEPPWERNSLLVGGPWVPSKGSGRSLRR